MVQGSSSTRVIFQGLTPRLPTMEGGCALTGTCGRSRDSPHGKAWPEFPTSGTAPCCALASSPALEQATRAKRPAGPRPGRPAARRAPQTAEVGAPRRGPHGLFPVLLAWRQRLRASYRRSPPAPPHSPFPRAPSPRVGWWPWPPGSAKRRPASRVRREDAGAAEPPRRAAARSGTCCRGRAAPPH